ncbi:protein of unknown function [Pseudorhizobium banfieldiae]|uniref:Uncharacterized protein n=1 Tax=Pseudorhizobium banfieldiae TaxID=1125847 RepID=L0NCU5_9HYPH|nr:protein of unknown function [Pseudorhizobium banfieldiae]
MKRLIHHIIPFNVPESVSALHSLGPFEGERRAAKLDDLEKILVACRRRRDDSRLWLASLQGIAWALSGRRLG